VDNTSIYYRIGQLVAVVLWAKHLLDGGDYPQGALHNVISAPQTLQRMYDAYILPRRLPQVRRRWQRILAELAELPQEPLTLLQQGIAMSGYIRERDAIARAEEMLNWRTQAGLTQAELAELLLVSPGAVEHWEQHRRDCPRHVLQLARHTLGGADGA